MRIIRDPNRNSRIILEAGDTFDNIIIFLYPWTPPFFGIHTPTKLVEVTAKYMHRLRKTYGSTKAERLLLGEQE